MADQKLSPSLFLAKAATPTKSATRYLHFVVAVRQAKNEFSLTCESQPLMSFRCYGLPGCTVCGTSNPIKENPNDSHEE